MHEGYKGCRDRTWHNVGTYQLIQGIATTLALQPAEDGTVQADAARFTNLTQDRAFTYSYNADGQTTHIYDTTDGARVADYATTYDALGRTTPHASESPRVSWRLWCVPGRFSMRVRFSRARQAEMRRSRSCRWCMPCG